MLLIIATPIGHLADVSQRALDALRSCDRILCEDTRRSRILLRHYGIEKPLHSFHLFNEKKEQERILQDLEQGLRIALISDAGSPLISDPGLFLVQECVRRNLAISAIPGPCSLIVALQLSGFNAARFQFIGFLPRETGSLNETLRRALFYPGVSIAFESPQRLANTLKIIESLDPLRRLAIARELTKAFEECRRGTAAELLAHFLGEEPRGEIILLIDEGKPPQIEIGVEETVSLLQELHGISLKEAIKAAARLKNMPKHDVYQHIHHSSALKKPEHS